MLIRTFLIAFLALIPGASKAQPFWQQTNGPAGGMSWDITQTPDGDLYILSDAIFRSSDNGEHWICIMDTLPYGFITNIHATNTGTLVAVKGNGEAAHAITRADNRNGLFISLDRGQTWRHQNLSRWIWGVTSNSQGHIYASAGVYWAGEFVLFRSTDKGLSWDTTVSPTIQSSLPLHLWCDSSGVIFTYGYRSTDDGVSWSKLLNGYPPSTSWSGFTVAPDHTIYSGNLKSTDAGRTWSEVFSSQASLYEVHAVNAEGAILDASGWAYPYVYLDGERRVTHGMPYLGYNQQTPDYYVAAGLKDSSFLLAKYLGFYRLRNASTDTWVEHSVPTGSVHALACHPNGQLIASTVVRDWPGASSDHTIAWWSSDQGESWRRASMNDSKLEGLYSLAIDSSHNVIAGGSRGKIFVSEDAGVTFISRGAGIGYSHAVALAVAPNGNIFAAAQNLGVFRSSDNGLTWDQLNSGIEGGIYSIGVGHNGKVYAGSLLRVYVSTNDGLTWGTSSIGLPDPPDKLFGGRTTALVVNNQGYILAGIDSFGMYVSIDDGETWQALNTGLGNLHITSLLNTPSDKVFASTRNGVYYLQNIQDAWTEAFTGLTVRSTLSLTRNSAGTVFVGTEGTGVLRSSQTFNVASQGAVNSLTASSLIRISPNPVRNSLHVESIRPGYYTVLDIMGRIVSQGTLTSEIDVSDLTAGSYFLHLEGEQPVPFVKH